MPSRTIRLLIQCPDRRGIVAAVANFIAQYDGNILDADQHTDALHGEFFMRVEIDPAVFRLSLENFTAAWQPLADKFAMDWSIHWGAQPRRVAILVSKLSHCVSDLLWRWREGELDAEIPLVVSNHEACRAMVEALGVEYRFLPVSAENKKVWEAEVGSLLAEARIDLIVLARYMQVLSPAFVARYPGRIINIHHSFLPAFAGGKPYHQAFERGVKIIGATSHYVTDVLDDGPIIAQSTLAVNHRDSIDDLVRKGRDLERIVLANAVRAHLDDRVIVSRNKTVVFE
ncbi:MAG: formyltetrahydrofolate deformylase [Phycisphaerae bacterium]